MDGRYVKFLRGTFENYNKLTQKDADTLYFVYNTDSSTTALYLGDRLIAGTGTIIGAETLAALEDVALNNDLAAKDFLRFNGSEWENVSFDFILSEIENNISLPASTAVYEVIPNKGETHNQALTRISSGNILAQGDFGVVKELIIDNKYAYTSYVYNGSIWIAMDGNYSTDNVYFNDDLTVTSPVGTITQTMIDEGNGAATLDAAGKSVKEVFTSLLAQEKQPIVVSPTASINVSGGSGEVGSSYSAPIATLSVTDGSYTYGSKFNNEVFSSEDTGVIFAIGDVVLEEITSGVSENNISNAKDLTNGESVKLTAAGNDLIYSDTSKTYSFSGSAKYTPSNRIPVSNIGNLIPEKQIGYDEETETILSKVEVSIGGTSSATFSGWRKMFMGYVDEYDEISGIKNPVQITSNLVRGLNLISKQVSSSAQEFTVPVGATKIIIACPEEYSLSKCEYYTMSWETIANFPQADDLMVADARGGENGLKNYHIYIFEHANPSGFEASTKYRITLKKG